MHLCIIDSSVSPKDTKPHKSLPPYYGQHLCTAYTRVCPFFVRNYTEFEFVRIIIPAEILTDELG